MEWSLVISHILEIKGWSISQLCEATGFDYKYVHALKSGKSKNPKTEFIKTLVKNIHLNPEWLLTGEGEMFHGETFAALDSDENKPALEFVSPDPRLSVSSPLNQGSGIDVVPTDLPALQEAGLPECEDSELIGARIEGARSIEVAGSSRDEERVYVEFYSSQTAGAGPAQEVETFQPITPQEIIKRFINPWRADQVKAIEVRGDSMTKVGLFDRDIVLFVPKEKEGDGIFVISIENRMQVKRLEFDLLGKTLRIISENDRYAPRVLTTEDEMARVVIEGKVVGWLHKHPY
jgi:SOS-response transcriptional repressor LexA